MASPDREPQSGKCNSPRTSPALTTSNDWLLFLHHQANRDTQIAQCPAGALYGVFDADVTLRRTGGQRGFSR